MLLRIALVLIVLCGSLATIARAADAPASPTAETPAQRDARMKWWREARFGMFIHWGLYAVPAGEWKGKQYDRIGEWIMNTAQIPVPEYEQLATKFNPVKFDAKEWVSIAKNAGMKYIVITSKHHDGFSMFGSDVSDYTIAKSTPFKRDPIKELADECTKQGVRLCFYYSIMDWHHPDANGTDGPDYNDKARITTHPDYDKYEAYMRAQLKELLTKYGDVGVLWFDGEWVKDWTEERGTKLYADLRAMKPDLIINNRIGKSRKSMQGMSASADSAGDFGTPEQQIPANGMPGVDWESCMTMNDTWGYKSFDHNWKSTETVLRNLVDIASKGGNYLLNVGPTAEGVIPPESVERLKQIGEWMKVNGESVYGTTANPLTGPEAAMWSAPPPAPATKPGEAPATPQSVELGRVTKRVTDSGSKLYFHVFEWGNGIRIPPLGAPIKAAYLLADPKKTPLGSTVTASTASIIHLPKDAPDPIDSVVVVELDDKPGR